MSYNRQYRTRTAAGRYNTPGQFVSAGEQQPQQFGNTQQQSSTVPSSPMASQQFNQPQTPLPKPPQTQQPPLPQQPPPPQAQEQQQQQDQNFGTSQQPSNSDIEMKVELEMDDASLDGNSRPHWMKSKLPGVKKISKRERRRRQNEHLRRLLVPKNALMVLNEMTLHEQINNHFKVELADSSPFFKSQNKHNFCADLTLEGQTYKGYGENKLMARNAAAEQAIRDLIIKRLSKVCADSSGDGTESQNGESEEETLPMIQIASFALHKLFLEWEYAGHKVPQLRPPPVSCESEAEAECAAARAAVVKPPKAVPVNASAMHPCMLLTYMRPHLEYRELAVDGDRPQNMLFTLGVDVDGATYVGKASNKKEARKAAARAACQALFNVKFDDVPTANTPIAPPPPPPTHDQLQPQ
ncbi:double-stranded RNA-specific editase B2-like [Achroia grisella]|uniref:double-stranded RNA-specific editase B2-like n=1 Tax=Achroia grisella TaxID=688607 RepID=UPI0027D28B65|nr:double-stranded RNA-specific editase B2-like [Achroia grisella]